MDSISTLSESTLFQKVKKIIESGKNEIALSVNFNMSFLYWKIGTEVNKQLEHSKEQSSYGKGVVENLSTQLVKEYGKSFSIKNLRRMMQFATLFPDQENVVSLIRQLSWTHIIAIIPIKEELKRDFYIQMAAHERWSVRTLRERIKSMLYERTAIGKTRNSRR